MTKVLAELVASVGFTRPQPLRSQRGNSWSVWNMPLGSATLDRETRADVTPGTCACQRQSIGDSGQLGSRLLTAISSRVCGAELL